MITLIAAMDRNRLIGRDNTLPWHIPEDFKHFKNTTMGFPIIMGRKTYESLPTRPLPGRTNIVVSRSVVEDAISTNTVAGAIGLGLSLSDQIFVIGGQSIYEQTIGIAQRLLITHIDEEHDGNYWFPEINVNHWIQSKIISEGSNYKIAEYLALG